MNSDLAFVIDAAGDAKDRKQLAALRKECAKQLQTSKGAQRPLLHYYRANIYAHINACDDPEGRKNWDWHLPNRVSEILCLRQAIKEPSFREIHVVMQCRIRTNLGNSLNIIGRPIAAIEQWDAALALQSNFPMASGNRALGLCAYARSLYDTGHAQLLFASAKEDLDAALDDSAQWDAGERTNTGPVFDRHLAELKAWLSSRHPVVMSDAGVLGRGREQRYRQWCLDHRLFLNPLNDAGVAPIAARDVLHLPDHVYGLHETPRFPAYYNLLKQEFVSARYRLHLAVHGDASGFIDRNVVMYEMGDAAVYGHLTEEFKASFRAAYSIFDKSALFLNDYYSLGVDAGAVNFRSVWTEANANGKGLKLRDVFDGNKNLPLRGLYFLSKDLFDDAFAEVAEPDAAQLAKLRNRIEHRFVSLQHYGNGVSGTDAHCLVPRDEFESKALRMLKLAREALVYLSLAMHREEKLRSTDRKPTIMMPIISPPIRPHRRRRSAP